MKTTKQSNFFYRFWRKAKFLLLAGLVLIIVSGCFGPNSRYNGVNSFADREAKAFMFNPTTLSSNIISSKQGNWSQFYANSYNNVKKLWDGKSVSSLNSVNQTKSDKQNYIVTLNYKMKDKSGQNSNLIICIHVVLSSGYMHIFGIGRTESNWWF